MLGFLGLNILVKSINRVVSAGVVISAMVCMCVRAHMHGEMEFDDNTRMTEFDIQLGGEISLKAKMPGRKYSRVAVKKL